MVVYTSITKSYLPKARILAKSIKHFHPKWTFILLLSDDLPIDFDLTKEPFDEILTIDQLGIQNWKSWAFGHALVELCTAVKGPAAHVIASRPNVDKLMYLDPDIKVYSSLESLEQLLEKHQILLTPHLLDFETDMVAIQDNEISALKHGVYNLGFFAARTSGQGLSFIKWWAKRLEFFCEDNIPGGLFTDQKWCDLAPAFFSDLHIVRDRGCNVATWNIAHRPLSKNSEGKFYVADVPLKFYHFTSYDNGNGRGMLQKYVASQVAYDLWDEYGKELKNEGNGDVSLKNWYYNCYQNGAVIPSIARKVYRKQSDLRTAFADPYSVAKPSFSDWWQDEVKNGNLTPGVKKNSLYALSINLISKTLQRLKTPRSAVHLFKRIAELVKREGFAGLFSRIKRL